MNEEKQVNLGRHEAQCSICKHADREQIEEQFIHWTSPEKIRAQFGISRDSIYRHAHALNLMDMRRRNLRSALERIVERADDVEVNAGAIVQAAIALGKINAKGMFVERQETVNLNALFARMSSEELEAYAHDGSLPAWFTGATNQYCEAQ